MSNTYQIEITDTFAGEANYSWVKRDTMIYCERNAMLFEIQNGLIKILLGDASS